MKKGTVTGIYICAEPGAPMESVEQVRAIRGRGLEEDRYSTGEGSWNKEKGMGHRQVTLINTLFVDKSPFTLEQTRRNIGVSGLELMLLIGKRFTVDGVTLLGVKYCDPCERPSNLCGIPGFADAFHDVGGLIATVIKGGIIRVGSVVTPPPRKRATPAQ